MKLHVLARPALAAMFALQVAGCVEPAPSYPPPPPPQPVYPQPPPPAYPPPPDYSQAPPQDYGQAPPQDYGQAPPDQGGDVTASEAPPPLPDYDQPECPGPGYMWTPGYWAWNGGAYYWVPGTWVLPPQPEVLWTPPWWGWAGGVFVFHAGYWGPHIGFYGGVNYGFGYGGIGFVGGYWNHGAFFYNTAVTHVNVVNVTNVYRTNVVVNNITVNNRVSFNGGPGGLAARPTPAEMQAQHEQHFRPTGEQFQHREAARATPAMFARQNHGAPPIGATPRPGAFNDAHVAPTRGFSGGGQRPQNFQAPAGQQRQAPQFGQPQQQRPQQPQYQHGQRPQQSPYGQRPENQPAPGPQQHPQQPQFAPHPQVPQQPHPPQKPKKEERH